MKDWFTPYPHQVAAIDKLFSNQGKLILAHQTGTGKTATAIYGFEKMRQEGKASKALVVVPAGLRDNFATSGVGKFTNSSYQVLGSGGVHPSKLDPSKTYTVVSYDALRRNPVGLMQATGPDTLILDEFHSTRNEQAGIFKAAVRARQMATNFIGLTASLINNSPKEIASLLTISEGNRGMSPKEFGRRYTQTVGFEQGFTGKDRPVIAPRDEAGIAKITAPRIDYVQTTDLPGNSMPEKKVTNVPVPMSDDQYRLYRLALKKLGPMQEWITRRDKNVTVKDANLLFAQIAEARQLSNSVASGRSNVDLQRSADVTPKAKRILDDTETHLKEDPSHSVVLYSNLVRGGVDVLQAGLRKRGITPAVFIGAGTEVGGDKVTNSARQEGVNDFKSGKRRVIILSGAGAEGLDLKDATAFYAMDGHFNPERILQAEARARRLGGQSFREPEKRVVDTRRYMSVVPDSEKPGVLGRMMGKRSPQTTDEWMYGVAGQKWNASSRFYDVIKQPHKYLRKYVDTKGRVRYEYNKEPSTKAPSFFQRLIGAKPANPTPARPEQGPGPAG